MVRETHAGRPCASVKEWRKQETESPLSPHSPTIVFCCNFSTQAARGSASWGQHLCFTSYNAEARCGPVNFTGILNGALQALSPWEAEPLTEGGCHYRCCLSSVNPSHCNEGISHRAVVAKKLLYSSKHTRVPSLVCVFPDFSIHLAGMISFTFDFHFF